MQCNLALVTTSPCKSSFVVWCGDLAITLFHMYHRGARAFLTQEWDAAPNRKSRPGVTFHLLVNGRFGIAACPGES
jgi:hypothetical protein